ncbi:MAG: hypothetical protein IBJ11_07840, partial [Phycisphaerales bacterium]|nr:hypothetical protein [Phycisphaerales bacterium]
GRVDGTWKRDGSAIVFSDPERRVARGAGQPPKVVPAAVRRWTVLSQSARSVTFDTPEGLAVWVRP